MQRDRSQHASHTLQSWVVCLTAALFFFYEFVQMSMFNAINPSLMHDFHISPAQLGNLSAAYFYANIIFMFPAGILLDRYPIKCIITISMILCIAGTMVFSFTDSLSTAMICRFLTGIGGSFPFLSCLKLATRWFPPRKMAYVSGIMLTMAMLGGVVAQTPLTLLVEFSGWRNAVLIDSCVGIGMLLLILLFVKEAPKHYTEAHKERSHLPLLKSILAIFCNKQNWSYGIYTCLLNLPVFLLAQLWGSLYLTQVHHLSQTDASYATSFIFIGTILGSPFFGWLSDKMGVRKSPMYLGGVLSLIIICIIMLIPAMSLSTTLILFFLLGFFTSTQVISYPAIAESNSPELIGGGLGLASVLIMSGGAIFEPLFGWLMQRNWQHIEIDNIPVYAANDYFHAMAIMPIAFIIGLIAIFFATETYCKNRKAEEQKIEGTNV
jgi:MFS family permease